MPLPREFDEGVALEAAMQRFWATGYAATSVRELGGAMGLGQAGVYNAFGDKRTLSTQCLDRYLDANMRARIARVEKTLPPRQAIETFLTQIVERPLESRLGCLLANAALEVAPHDRHIDAVLAERIGELEAFFRGCVVAGQNDGSISPDADGGTRGKEARVFDSSAILLYLADKTGKLLGSPEVTRRNTRALHPATEGTHRSRRGLWPLARRSLGRRSRQNHAVE